MPRLLLLIPTTTYKTTDFVEAARRLDVDVVIASEKPSTLERALPNHLWTLDLGAPEAAAADVAARSAGRPIDAVVAVDELTTVVAAAVAERLGLRTNPVEAVRASRSKALQRPRLRDAGVRVPEFRLASLDDDRDALAADTSYPCVVKPTSLSASRGVIRADDPISFVAAVGRIDAIVERAIEEEAVDRGADRSILIERFVPGGEVALEGLLIDGSLRVLALFDKPDPLDGPFFEETIYVTPSELDEELQRAIADEVEAGCRALGLAHGPIHAELRLPPAGPTILEIAARTIGGLCARTLRFGTGRSLEELVLRHALDLELDLERQPRPAGVMMIPIPRRGTLERVGGVEEAEAVEGVEDVTITAHRGQLLEPLPEGARYLGFIFARAESPTAVCTALRQAHAHLNIAMAEPSTQ